MNTIADEHQQRQPGMAMAKEKAVDLSAPQIPRLEAEIDVATEQSERIIYLQKCMQLNAANVGTLAIRRQLPGCHCSKS